MATDLNAAITEMHQQNKYKKVCLWNSATSCISFTLFVNFIYLYLSIYMYTDTLA